MWVLNLTVVRVWESKIIKIFSDEDKGVSLFLLYVVIYFDVLYDDILMFYFWGEICFVDSFVLGFLEEWRNGEGFVVGLVRVRRGSYGRKVDLESYLGFIRGRKWSVSG